ncbi:MAG: hypothetical protein AB8B53_09950 [Flavobacteriales bacterium]
MLQLLFIGSMATVFYRLAKTHGKLAWLFGIIGGFMAWLFARVSSLIIVGLDPGMLSNTSTVVTVYKLMFLSLALAGFFCWLLFSLLDYLWKKEKATSPNTETLDEDIEGKS